VPVPSHRDPLQEVLRSAQDLGLLGPGPVEDQRRHAEAFCRLVAAALPTDAPHFLDLGSGAGLPGLVLAALLPRSSGTLLDSQRRRGRFLDEAIHSLRMAARLETVSARAEDAARDAGHRERYDLVVARSFASPAVTAECAVAFLHPEGHLAVSEPPEEAPERWDEGKLRDLGLEPPTVVRADGATAAILRRTGAPVDPKWPRKPGIPQKRPLW
jgi:16S rRNA (guanine527-N7)-methyltransferase